MMYCPNQGKETRRILGGLVLNGKRAETRRIRRTSTKWKESREGPNLTFLIYYCTGGLPERTKSEESGYGQFLC